MTKAKISVLIVFTALLAALVICAASCSETVSDSGVTEKIPSQESAYDIDLTSMSSTMVYSQVYDMITNPDSYIGKKVKMKGSFTYGVGDDRYYFACLIADATACCSQGIEFVLKDERLFPDDYPEVGQDITVSGIFNTYREGEYLYCELRDAEMIQA